MNKLKIIDLFDKLFVNICLFLLIFAWINFYLRNLWLSFVLSVIFSIAITYLVFYLLTNKSKKKNKILFASQLTNEKFLSFRLTSLAQKIELISKKMDVEILKDENNNLYFEKDGKKTLLIFCLNKTIDNINIVDALENKINAGYENFWIFCEKSNCDLKPDDSLNVKFFDKVEISNSIVPDDWKNMLKINSPNKLTKKEILKNIFTPQKAKSYFLCGLVLIFSSIILPFHIYYLIFGSTLILFSIICKILKHYE